jgi:hypothetical protein
VGGLISPYSKLKKINMIDLIISYFLLGALWLIICDFGIQRMPNNGTRIRYFLFWPITLTAFIVGFIDALIRSFNEGE